MAGADCSPTKVCLGCHAEKPLDAYYRRPNGQAGHLPRCKQCVIDASARNRAKPKGLKNRGPCRSCGIVFDRLASGKMRHYCSVKCRRSYVRPACDVMCSIVGCGNGARSGSMNGVCHTHYQAAWKADRLRDARQRRAATPCATCGDPIGMGQRKYCGKKCRDSGDTTRSIRRSVARAYMYAKRNVNVVQFDPVDVLARDGWRCRMCGVMTPKALRGKNLPTSPELDHIIPISKGGPHAPWNTQCLCRRCNRSKGATIKGQFGLPFAA